MTDQTFRPTIHPLALGATLYIPGVHPDLEQVLVGTRFPYLRSVIVCLEDAIREDEVPSAISRLSHALNHLGPSSPLCFVRPRSIEMLTHLLNIPEIAAIRGFVLPKASLTSTEEALQLVANFSNFVIMPILETVEVFDGLAMNRLATFLSQPNVRPRVLMARIGGNDLLRCLGLRRDLSKPIYASPLGAVISGLVTTFLTRNIPLSAPVFEGLGDPAVLREEVRLDMSHGLFSKSAIHPDQVLTIEDLYRPMSDEVATAKAIVADGARAVFKMYDRMNETAVHGRWANQVLDRAGIFGVNCSALQT